MVSGPERGGVADDCLVMRSERDIPSVPRLIHNMAALEWVRKSEKIHRLHSLGPTGAPSLGNLSRIQRNRFTSGRAICRGYQRNLHAAWRRWRSCAMLLRSSGVGQREVSPRAYAKLRRWSTSLRFPGSSRLRSWSCPALRPSTRASSSSSMIWIRFCKCAGGDDPHSVLRSRTLPTRSRAAHGFEGNTPGAPKPVRWTSEFGIIQRTTRWEMTSWRAKRDARGQRFRPDQASRGRRAAHCEDSRAGASENAPRFCERS